MSETGSTTLCMKQHLSPETEVRRRTCEVLYHLDELLIELNKGVAPHLSETRHELLKRMTTKLGEARTSLIAVVKLGEEPRL